jgi:glycosyltransferase involved in cell wall biosynthesis
VKIAFYCPNKPLTHPHPSGDLVIAQGIQSALNRLGHDCREIVRFRARWFWKTGAGCIEAVRALAAAWRAARVHGPQIWMTYHSYYKSPDVVGPIISKLLSIPYVIFQPMYGTRRGKDTGTSPGFHLNRWALKCARHVFSNNLRDLEGLSRIVSPERITYLTPGIYPEEFERDLEGGRKLREELSIPADQLVILTAARWREGVKSESFLHLLNALLRLESRYSEFTLLVVGDGPKENELREAALSRLRERVVFAGRVPRASMARFYSTADIFAFPGIGESLGMVFLEAQSCGTPVVALDTAGVPQVVMHGETGLLAVLDDGGEALGEALESLARDPQRRRALGDAGARFVRQERNLHHNYRELSDRLKSLAGELDR